MNCFLKPFRLVVLIATFLPSLVLAECTLNIRVNDAPPQYMQIDGRWTGRAVELMEVLLKEANCKANYKVLPWARALKELEKGTIDGMMNMGYNKQRASHYHYISPHIWETTVLVVRKDAAFEVNSLEDLKSLPLQIGYEQGNIFDTAFTEKFTTDEAFKNKFKSSPTGDLTEMVLRGRISAELDIIESAYYMLNNNPEYGAQLKVLPFKVSSLPTFLAFSKKTVSKDLLIQLHAANIRAIANGDYEKVVQKWAH